MRKLFFTTDTIDGNEQRDDIGTTIKLDESAPIVPSTALQLGGLMGIVPGLVGIAAASDATGGSVTAGDTLGSAAPVFGSIATIANYIGNLSPTSSLGHHWVVGSTVTVNLNGLGIAGEVADAKAALDAWSRVANIHFVYTTGAAQITITDDNDNANYNAYTNTYWSSFPNLNSATIHISQLWYKNNGGAGTAGVGTLNSYGYQTYLHELGHAMGLGHDGPYNGTATYGTSNIYTNDSWQFSVMSYFDQRQYGGASFTYITSPMQVDIAAMQLLYGEPTDPTTHFFGYLSNVANEYDFAYSNSFTIYTKDHYAYLDSSDYAGSQTAYFDAGLFSSMHGYTNNVGNAVNTHLSGYYGGSGSDSIYFGSSANGARYAYGDDGDDFFYNNGSSDITNTIAAYGGAGRDVFDEQASVSSFSFKHLSQTSNAWLLTAPNLSYDTLYDIETARFTGYDVSLRAAKNNFNFAGANDVGATSDFILQVAGNVVTWTVQNGVVVSGKLLTSAGSVPGWSVVGTGDFNGDGSSDILLNNNGSFVEWLTGKSGSVVFGQNIGYAPGWSVVGTGDFNNDGTSDILLRAGDTIVDWLTGPNGTVTVGNLIGNAAGWTVAGTGDFNGDGTSDILLREAGGTVVRWNMNSGGVVTSGALVGTAAGYTVVGTGDFNGDGQSDILLLSSNGTFVDWITGANGAVVSGNVLGTAAGWSVVGTGDYNGDGIADIALMNGNTIVDWIMNSNGSAITAGHLVGNTGGFSIVPV